MKTILFLFSSILFWYPAFAQTDSIDYSKGTNWAVLPGSYPDELKEFAKGTAVEGVDVFYVYPTLIMGKDDKRWNVPIEDEKQRKSVLESAVRFQASAWAEAGTVYVPYYRQAHLRSYFNLENGGRDALLLAYSDVKAAFAYYLKHYNKGRGIILAGHSQGGTHISMLLNDFFDEKELQKQLVAAYLPGIGVAKDEYTSIPLMVKPNQTGGFVSWNTFKRKFDEDHHKWYVQKAVINPVTWDTTLVAKRDMHQGFLFSNGKMYRKSFTTHLDDGVVWISLPHFPYRYLSFSMKNYHVGDVNLFWEDIRLNAVMRSKAYIEKTVSVK